MPLMQDVRNIFARTDGSLRRLGRRLTPRTAAASSERAASIMEPKPVTRTAKTGGGGDGGGGSGTSTVDASPDLITRLEAHLADRERRSDQLLDRLGPTLDALPDLARVNTRMLEGMERGARATADRHAAMTGLITKLNEGVERQAEALATIEHRLERTCQSTEDLASAVDEFREGIQELTRTQVTSNEALHRLAEATKRREEHLETTLSRSMRWIIACVVCCAGASIAALLAAIAALT